MKKNTIPSSSCSSSSSSCIDDSPINNEIKNAPIIPKIMKKPPKRVRAKKVVANNSGTSPKSRSSIFRGVTRHRWTGRYEAHLWDKSTWNNIQNKRGRQIYLGAYDSEDDSARTYDLASLKYWGPTAILNFPLETYTKELEEMQKLTKEEFLASLRRRSSGFSRGVSKYRGVARHHHNGRWEARIGRVSGNKYLYLGTYDTQEEAAAAYDMAAIEFRGPKAVTNFDISSYTDKLKKIQPDHIQQVKEEEVQVKREQKIIPDSSNKIQVANEINYHRQVCNQVREANVIYDHQQQIYDQVQQNIPKLELMDSQEMDITDPLTNEHEHPWDLCLDTDFNLLPIPDIPHETESGFLGLFHDKGFVEDIEFIFDGPLGDFDLQDAMSGTGGGGKVEAEVARESEVMGLFTSPSSSSLSTMTPSVCSNM